MRQGPVPWGRLLLLLLSGLFLGPGCRSRPVLAVPASPAQPAALPGWRTSATELPRPWEVGPNAPVSLEPSEAKAAPPDDPFGLWMVEVLVLDEDSRPIEGAQVESVRGADTTNSAGRAWVPPFGLDIGSPTRDHRYKTLRVSAAGHVEEKRWVGLGLGPPPVFRVFRLRRER